MVEVVLRVSVGSEPDTARYVRKYCHELKAVEPGEERVTAASQVKRLA